MQTGVGVSRAVSAGNAAAVSVADYLDWYADDDATAVSLAYLEGVDDGCALFERLAAVARRKPVVLVKGGTTASGQRAAASHTGSLAADDRIFDGMCRQAGITRDDRRGGVRGGRDVRDAAAAARSAHRGAHDRRGMGRGHRRCDRARARSGARVAPRRPARRDRREAPAAVEPQQSRSTSRAARPATRFPR